jgi:hypothetical protein
VKPIVLANNRWRCDHGWDIDLDDGSSNYVIRNNLCLHGGIKNREGFGRVVENNVLVDGGFDPHVWYADSGDVFRRNIVWTAYRPARMPPPPWGAEMDFNLVQGSNALESAPARTLQQQSGRDEHSLQADARFVDAARGDYRVMDDSPARALGFVNFPMDQFGVQKPELKAIARVPLLPRLSERAEQTLARDVTPLRWLGAEVRNVADEGERSAFGLTGVTGVLILSVSPGSALANLGVRKNDVILSVDDQPIPDTDTLQRLAPAWPTARPIGLWISRDQRQLQLSIAPIIY